MKCQMCQGRGHSAIDCPTQKKKLQKRIRCQLCGEAGHGAVDCTADPEDDEEDVEDDEEDDDTDEATPSPAVPSPAAKKAKTGTTVGGGAPPLDDDDSADTECLLCHAAAGAQCEEGCISATTRADRIDRAKAKSTSKVVTTTAAAAVKKITAATDDEIAVMDAAGIAKLPLRAIVMRPYAWTHYIAGGVNAQEKRERHKTLFEALATALGLGSGDARGILSQIDITRARADMQAMSDLLDPAMNLGERINQYAIDRGQELVAIKDARERGWVEVRAALDIFKGTAQGDRKWAQALAKAAARTKTTTSTGAEGGRGGGGRGRGRFGKGGRGAKAGGKGNRNGKDGGRGGGREDK